MNIIESLLDVDLYKFSMQQAVLHQFPSAHARFKFKCRNSDVRFNKQHADRILWQTSNLCDLKFTQEELDYLKGIYFLKPDYIDFLRGFKPNPKYIDISLNNDGELGIIIEGPWVQTILFETAILSIVNEVYFNEGSTPQSRVADCSEGSRRFFDKINVIKNYHNPNFKFSEFGARRRYSRSWHDSVVKELSEKLPNNFIGTSDVYFARKYGVKPIGTMAHEWIQAGQALTNIQDSQKFMLQKWADEYRGELGIALSDTLGLDTFLRDFDSYFAKLFDGVRHDSGDPIAAGEKVIKHYEKLRIDPRTKTIIFSDGLDIPKAIELYKHFKGRIKVSFGIGTNLTNDMGHEPLNIVIKMVSCNGQPVAKISDNNGKGMCEDENYLKMLKSILGKEK